MALFRELRGNENGYQRVNAPVIHKPVNTTYWYWGGKQVGTE